MQNPSDTPWRGLGSPAVDVNPTTLAPARTGKTRRGRRGGRGRSLSPRPCGVLGPGVVSPAPAVGWFATPEVVGHHPPQHRVGAAPLTSSTREDMPESGTVAWGHQDMFTDPLSIAWMNTSRSFYQARCAFGHNPSPTYKVGGAGVSGSGNGGGLCIPRLPVPAEGAGFRPREPPARLVERVGVHLGDMTSLFSNYRRHGMSLSATDMEKVEEQMSGVSALLFQLKRGLAEAQATVSRPAMPSPAAAPPSRLPGDGPPEKSQGLADMAAGMASSPGRGRGVAPGGFAVTGMGSGGGGGGAGSKAGMGRGEQLPPDAFPMQIGGHLSPPHARGSAATQCSMSSADNDGEVPKKKKRRGKRGIRKGKKQMEGFAGFPLAPGLGPEFAGQPRRRLPKTPSLHIMGGEHDLSEFCLQDDDLDEQENGGNDETRGWDRSGDASVSSPAGLDSSRHQWTPPCDTVRQQEVGEATPAGGRAGRVTTPRQASITVGGQGVGMARYQDGERSDGDEDPYEDDGLLGEDGAVVVLEDSQDFSTWAPDADNDFEEKLAARRLRSDRSEGRGRSFSSSPVSQSPHGNLNRRKSGEGASAMGNGGRAGGGLRGGAAYHHTFHLSLADGNNMSRYPLSQPWGSLDSSGSSNPGSGFFPKTDGPDNSADDRKGDRDRPGERPVGLGVVGETAREPPVPATDSPANYFSSNGGCVVIGDNRRSSGDTEDLYASAARTTLANGAVVATAAAVAEQLQSKEGGGQDRAPPEGICAGRHRVIGTDDDTPRDRGGGYFRPWQLQQHGDTLSTTPRLYGKESMPGAATAAAGAEVPRAVPEGRHTRPAGTAVAPGFFSATVGASSCPPWVTPPRTPRTSSGPLGSTAAGEENDESRLTASRSNSPTRYRSTVADVQEAFERADTRVAMESGWDGEKRVVGENPGLEMDIELSSTLRELWISNPDLNSGTGDTSPTPTSGRAPAATTSDAGSPQSVSRSQRQHKQVAKDREIALPGEGSSQASPPLKTIPGEGGTAATVIASGIAGGGHSKTFVQEAVQLMLGSSNPDDGKATRV